MLSSCLLGFSDAARTSTEPIYITVCVFNESILIVQVNMVLSTQMAMSHFILSTIIPTTIQTHTL